MLNVSEFILDGPKEMLRQIKEATARTLRRIQGGRDRPATASGRGCGGRDVDEGAGPYRRRPARREGRRDTQRTAAEQYDESSNGTQQYVLLLAVPRNS